MTRRKQQRVALPCSQPIVIAEVMGDEPLKVGAFLNVAEALTYLGIDRTRLYRSMEKLDARKAGRRTLISRKSLDRWFEGLPKVGPKGRRNRYG